MSFVLYEPILLPLSQILKLCQEKTDKKQYG
jgi:hypothetical protein